MKLVRRPGIEPGEPGSQEWESCMIPLHQRRLLHVCRSRDLGVYDATSSRSSTSSHARRDTATVAVKPRIPQPSTRVGTLFSCCLWKWQCLLGARRSRGRKGDERSGVWTTGILAYALETMATGGFPGPKPAGVHGGFLLGRSFRWARLRLGGVVPACRNWSGLREGFL